MELRVRVDKDGILGLPRKSLIVEHEVESGVGTAPQSSGFVKKLYSQVAPAFMLRPLENLAWLTGAVNTLHCEKFIFPNEAGMVPLR